MKTIGKLGLLIGSSLVAGLLMELLLRAVGYHYSPMEVKIADKNDAREYHIFETDTFIHDPDLMWRPRKSHSVFNAQGFRGPVVSDPKEPDAFRIFTVGDSNTLGWPDTGGPNWPKYVNELFQESDDNVTVMNAGVWGYTSFQGVARFEEVLEYEPDMVLISFGSNDAHRVTVSDEEFASRPIKTSGLDRTLDRFRLGHLILATVDRFSAKRAVRLKPRVGLSAYRANLNRIIARARTEDITIVLLTRPYVGGINDPYWWKNFGHEYNRATVEVAEQQDVLAVDLYSLFRNKGMLFGDESHFTEEGHREAARIVHERLRPFVRCSHPLRSSGLTSEAPSRH